VAQYWTKRQSEHSQRLGIRGDWANPYLTAAPHVAAKQLEVFADMVDKGYVYRGLKPVHWSLVDETALADHEVDYKMRKDPSIHVRFSLRVDEKGIFGDDAQADRFIPSFGRRLLDNPGQCRGCGRSRNRICRCEHEGNRYLVAAERLGATMARPALPTGTFRNSYTGAQLAGLIFQHPLFDRPSPAVLADYVTVGDGTGVVHTAPGQGKTTFVTGLKYGLPVLQVLTGNGYLTNRPAWSSRD